MIDTLLGVQNGWLPLSLATDQGERAPQRSRTPLVGAAFDKSIPLFSTGLRASSRKVNRSAALSPLLFISSTPEREELPPKNKIKTANALNFHAQRRRVLRSNYVNRSRSQPHQDSAFSIEKYGEKTAEKEECDDQLLAEYAMMLGVYMSSVAVLTALAKGQGRLPRRFGLFDLALLGIATHKLSRIVAKDRITSILRAPFVSYIRSAGAGEVEEEARGRGIQRGIGHLISCPYCTAPWSATALAFGFLFAPRISRFFAGILSSIAVSDFLHRAYVAAKESG